jgi:phospholipase/carboxylesterase
MTAYGKLSRFLDDILAGYPVDPATVLLFGFSMGTVMSYALALTRPDRIRGVAANSGYLPEVPSLTYRWQELARTEFFISHGTEDPVIPVAMARRARELLESSNAPISYHEYPMPHTIGEQSLRDVVAWTAGFLP